MEFSKYLKIKIVGHEDNERIFSDPEDDIVVEEKIDGGNFRFYINKGNIIFGSRTQQLTSNEGEEDNVGKNFKRCVDFVKDQLSTCDLSLLENKIFYGECCIKHTMNYDWEKIPPFLGFDIFCLVNNKFLANKEMLFNGINLPTVPHIKTVKAKNIKTITDNDVPKAHYFSPSSKDQKAEGIVLKNYSKQIFAKYVRDAFKEANADAFGGNPKYNPDKFSNNDIITFKYCTNPRIDKIIFKLLDEDFKLEMALMKQLPNRVYNDIMAEHWEDIVKSRWVVDFGSLKKMITRRCLSVLKQVIVNNALEVIK